MHTPTDPDQPRRCRFCGAILKRNRPGPPGQVCDGAACRDELAREEQDRTVRRHWTETLRRSREQVADAAADIVAAKKKLDAPAERVFVAALPLLERPLVPQDHRDRAQMIWHIDRIVAESFASGDAGVTRDRARLEAPVDPYIAAACATCKGACCAVGRDYLGFLTAETITQYRRHVPHLSPAEVRDSYLDRLPEQISAGSCYFHGPEGCTLEREQRDDVCHRHLCQQIRIQQSANVQDHDGPFVLVAADQDGNRAVALWEQGSAPRPLPRGGRPRVSAKTAEAIAAKAMARLPEAPPSTGRAVPPPKPTCTSCGRPITPAQAAITGSCGAPACERARRSRSG